MSAVASAFPRYLVVPLEDVDIEYVDAPTMRYRRQAEEAQPAVFRPAGAPEGVFQPQQPVARRVSVNKANPDGV